MKKILITILIILSVFLIYLANLDKKVYYLSLGDSLAYGEGPEGKKVKGYSDYLKDYFKKKQILEIYNNNYAEKGQRINDLIKQIKENKTTKLNSKEITLQNALIKADLLTLSIGANDLLTKINPNKPINYDKLYEYVDDISKELEELIKLIKEYCKEDIIVIGYYNPYPDKKISTVFEYLDRKYKEVCTNNNVTYIETGNIFKNNPQYLPNSKNIHPSEEAYHEIAKKIINTLNKTLLKP